MRQRTRGTTVLVPLARNPRSRRQLEVVHGEQAHVKPIGATLDTGTIASKYSVPARPAAPRGGLMIAGRGPHLVRKALKTGRSC